MASFILTHRTVWDHPAFNNIVEASAFVWMCSIAQWKDERVKYKGFLIDLKRGQIALSIRDMAAKWGWSISKVRAFLARIERDTMISTASDTGINIITICNYDKYQSLKEDIAHPATHPTTHERHTNDTQNKEGNEGNKRKKETDHQNQVDSQFDEWWSMVPKKVGRGQAEKAFCAALKKSDFQTLKDGIAAYKKSVNGTDPKYIKHPATWLNSQCWLDEPVKPKAPVTMGPWNI